MPQLRRPIASALFNQGDKSVYERRRRAVRVEVLIRRTGQTDHARDSELELRLSSKLLAGRTRRSPGGPQIRGLVGGLTQGAELRAPVSPCCTDLPGRRPGGRRQRTFCLQSSRVSSKSLHSGRSSGLCFHQVPSSDHISAQIAAYGGICSLIRGSPSDVSSNCGVRAWVGTSALATPAGPAPRVAPRSPVGDAASPMRSCEEA